jgi:hypothetical protein
MEEFKKLTQLNLEDLSDEDSVKSALLTDENDLVSLFGKKSDQNLRIRMPSLGTFNHTENHVLKENLKYLQNILGIEIKKYNEALWDVEDTVPVSDYESLQNEFTKKSREYGRLKNKINYLKENYEKLNSIKQKAIQDYRSLRQKLKLLNLSATPRPKWLKCVRVVDGGLDRWKQITANRSSDELVDILLNEFAGYTDNPYFSLNEPPYFTITINGKVNFIHNNRLNRREVGLTINEVWKAKREHDASKSQVPRMPLADFIDVYFESKYGSSKHGLEWSVNFKYSCEKHTRFDEAKFVNGVLKGEIDEELYHHFQDAIQLVHSNLTKIQLNELKWKRLQSGLIGKVIKDKSNYTKSILDVIKVLKKEKKISIPLEKQSKTQISRKGFLKALKESFLPTCNIDLNVLLEAVDKELKLKSNEDSIEFIELFRETDEGKVDGFLIELKKALDNDRLSYQQKIINSIENNSIKHIITKDNFIYCIKEIDMSLNEAQIAKFCFWLFKQNELNYDEFKKRLENGCICNSLARSTIITTTIQNNMFLEQQSS